MKLLIAEDDMDLNEIIVKKLRAEGFDVDTCFDGEDASYRLEYGNYDVAILDIMMPKMDGLQTISQVRSRGCETPVIFLTAKDSIADRVKGLNLGASDYVVKPFSFDELIARIMAVTRTASGNSTSVLSLEDLTLDLNSHIVARAGKEIRLTGKEYRLLEYLLLNKNQILARDRILLHVWGFDFDGSENVVDVYMNYIRKKIDEGHPIGVRYELTDDPTDDPLMTEVASVGEYHLYENLNTLSLGFMASSYLQIPIPESADPFLRQNMFIYQACGIEEVFHLQKPGYGKTVRFTASVDGRFLIYVPSQSRSYSPMESCSVTIMRGNEIVCQKTFDHLEVSWILDLGEVQKDDLIIINNKDKDALSVSVFPAIMDYEKYKEAIGILSSSPLSITEFSDTHIAGHVTVSSGQVLFTTIPYDPGWKLYVDGAETPYTDFEESFIICELPEGEHEIEFRYTPQGMLSGIIISAAALAGFLTLLFFRKKLLKNI